jgi:hypothetical protein
MTFRSEVSDQVLSCTCGTEVLLFQQVAEDSYPNRSANFKTVVEGAILELHPMVREESYFIGREVIINAFKHSEGRNIEAEIN